ncbi:MAG: radical SAM protein [Lachnospiraceae bacterium]
MEELQRYSVIHEKNKREIVLLRGAGCSWRKCRFCDYHLDFSKNQEENTTLNKIELDKVTGIYGVLEVINSGSFVDLSEETMQYIEQVCKRRSIKQIHFESHWNHIGDIAGLRQRFECLGIITKLKIGVESFDALFRESYLVKGITTDKAEEIALYFDECCLLQGIPGQTCESMKKDIEIGLSFFERVCINIMVENGMPIKPDPNVIEIFKEKIYPLYIHNSRVDILIENTDFGVGLNI